MTLLFSKKRKASLFIFCSCILFYGYKTVFKEKTEDPFLTLCKNSDAYYSHSYIDVTYEKRMIDYMKYVSVNNKLVVNTTKGVENYAFLNLDEYESNHLKRIKIRTLKADGTIVELDSSLVFKKDSKGKKFGEINYPIPAVEPGDTIETKYVYYEYLKKTELRSFVNLHTNLHSLNSQYTIKTGPEMLVRYKSYNKFPEPAIISNDSLVYLQFSVEKLKGIELNQYHCLPCDKPYLYYSLEAKDSKLRTWKEVYNEEFNFFTQPLALDYENSTYYKRWKNRVIGEAKDSSKFYKFNLLHTELLKNFKMQAAIQSEFIKSSGYFLKEGRFDPISIRRFYRQVFEDLEIDFWAVFGREKRSGEIDTYYIRKGEFEHIFFAYENEKGILNFLYPHEEFYMYQLDEIPTSLFNTKAILVKPKQSDKKRKKNNFINYKLELAEVDSVTVAEVNLPNMDSNINHIHQTISAKVDVKEKKTTFRYRFKVSGGMSTELRNFFNVINQNKEAEEFYNALANFEGKDNTMQIDTVISRVQNNKRPFDYVMNAEGVLNNAVNFINDSLISISVEKLIQHTILENQTSNSDLNYYLDFKYSDFSIFFFNFQNDFEVLGAENSTIDFKNDLGEYFFDIKKTNNNQLRFQSNYKILKDIIPKEELTELNTLNKQFESIKNKRIFIKLKNL